MHLSNQDKHTLAILLKQRSVLQSSRKPYHHKEAIDKLTKDIVTISNKAVYTAMPERQLERVEHDGIDTSKTIVLKRGESITLRMH
jgi:hypothetical protein